MGDHIDFKQIITAGLNKLDKNGHAYLIKCAKGLMIPPELDPPKGREIIYLPYSEFIIETAASTIGVNKIT